MANVNHKYTSGLQRMMREIQEKSVEFIRFEFGDMHGISRCKIVPSRHAGDKADKGIHIPLAHLSMDTSGGFADYAGYTTEIGWGDGVFLADPDSFRIVPWCRAASTAMVLMEPSFHDGKPVTAYPRYIARRQLDQLLEMGYSLLSAHEHEFYVVDTDSKKPLHQGNLRSSLANFANENLLYDFSRGLTDVGVDVENIDTEVSPGQFEITYKPAFGIRSADNAHVYRTAIKEMAQQQGCIASFMSKPWPNMSGNSAHFCHSLWDPDQKTCVMRDPARDLGISVITEYWMAGILAHAPAISLLLAPTTNCRQRLKPFSFAPINVTWGIDNRTCALRLKVYNSHGETGTYLENRMGSSASNPYLTLAATVAAGIDGIKKKLALPCQTMGDAYLLPHGSHDIPKTLQEAVEAFQQDKVIRDAFGKEFCHCFLAMKQSEIEKDKRAKIDGDVDWEFKQNFLLM